MVQKGALMFRSSLKKRGLLASHSVVQVR